MIVSGAAAYAQEPSIRVEHRTAAAGGGAAAAVVEAAAGRGITLIFRVTNPAASARSVLTDLELPDRWQVLFPSDRMNLAAGASFIDTVTLAPPLDAEAGDYMVRYEVRLSPESDPVATSVTVRVAARRQLLLSWADAPAYLPTGESGTFELRVANKGNMAETVTLDVRSSLGVPLQSSWTHGRIEPNEVRSVRVVRPAGRSQQAGRETLSAAVRAEAMSAVTESNLGFDVVPEGRAASTPRGQLPARLAIRTGSTLDPGFVALVGGGRLDPRRATTVKFGFREKSNPLVLEHDRNYVNITAPTASLAVGDQTWSLSPLTEAGHYGFGAGGRIERGRASGGAFLDRGRQDANEGSQAGGFLGIGVGRMATVSAQFLSRSADSRQSEGVADVGSIRLVLKPTKALTGDFEVGAGRSTSGAGKAGSGQIAFNSKRVSVSGRRVRRDDAYPIRDRTGLIDGAGVSIRPFGQFQFEGTIDGTGQIEDRSLPINAPTQQRATRATASWGSLARVTAGRTEWASPGQDWTAQWRREAVTAEGRIPLGSLWLSPGAERGTQASPSSTETPYSLSWLQAGARIGRKNNVSVKAEYGRGVPGDANRTVRRLSLAAALRPIEATSLTLQVQDGSTDALWLQGTQTVAATLDHRLPWRHHVVASYQRRSGGGIPRGDAEAYRVDYVIPIGIPLRSSSDEGRITIRLRNGDSGQPLQSMLVQLDKQSRLTDRDGVVTFGGLKAGDHHITVAPESVGQGRTVVPALPIRVSLKKGGRAEVNASIVRTARVTGTIRQFQTASGGLSTSQKQPDALFPGAAIVGAVLDLVVNDEHRTVATDAQGRFAFDDVPPGQWRLRVVRADVPSFFYLEEVETQVSLTPGQTREIMFRVVPKSFPGVSAFEEALRLPEPAPRREVSAPLPPVPTPQSQDAIADRAPPVRAPGHGDAREPVQRVSPEPVPLAGMTPLPNPVAVLPEPVADLEPGSDERPAAARPAGQTATDSQKREEAPASIIAVQGKSRTERATTGHGGNLLARTAVQIRNLVRNSFGKVRQHRPALIRTMGPISRTIPVTATGERMVALAVPRCRGRTADAPDDS